MQSTLAMQNKPSNVPAIQRKRRATSISKIVQAAIGHMVWDALPRKDAAAKAGISEHGLYKALRSPPVKAFYLSELEVLRTSERARNIHALVSVRDQDENKMARVAAVKTLEQISDTAPPASGPVTRAGLVIVINNAPQQIEQQPPNGANALTINGTVTNDD